MELRKVLKFIFTVENKYCYATKYKIIKILGIDIPVYKKTSFNGNRVFIIKNGIKTPIREKLTGLDIEFGDKSRNNTIIIEKPIHFIESKIICNGTNALINIASSQHNIKRLLIRCSSEKSNAFVNIDKNFFVNRAYIRCYDSNVNVKIGEDCMFSWGIQLLAGDGHPIKDKFSGEKINNAKFIEIGNHVWIAQDVKIMKNVRIADGCVIGAMSLVTKSFNEPNTVIAGNPAKIVKKGIEWARK